MISLEVAARQIAGAVGMAAGRENWKASLDRSIDAVFQSFAAFLFAAPLVILFSVSARRAATRIPDFGDPLLEAAPVALLAAGDLAIFAIDWAASLALLLALARQSGAAKQAADIVVGYNWIQPVIAAVQLPPVAVMAATASTAAGGALGLPAFAVTVFLIWGIARRGLGAGPGPAAAVVVMLIVVGAAVDMIATAAARALSGA